MPKNKKPLAIVLILPLIGIWFAQGVYAGGKVFSQAKERPYKEEVCMKVNFYTIDREKIDKGEFIGFAQLKDGKLIVEVTEPKLEKILKSPYTTMTGKKEDVSLVDRAITYEPGTLEHLRAIAIECYRFGYIGEIVKQ